jgi:hypothetical protein
VTWQSERTGIENNWFALTGRVVAVKVEADGDLHIALADATGDKPGIVVVEVPAKPQWCEIRQTVFSWSRDALSFAYSIHQETCDQRNAGLDRDRQGILGHWPCTERWFKPEKETAGLRCLGNTSGDETHR